MKLNNEAFTLLELLGVVIILGLLVTLTLPSVINSIKKSSNEIDNINKELAINAADLYIRDNKSYFDVSNGTEFCISLSDLVDGNYLKSPIQYKDSDDITNTHSIKVTYNDKYSYELIDSDSCPAIEVPKYKIEY